MAIGNWNEGQLKAFVERVLGPPPQASGTLYGDGDPEGNVEAKVGQDFRRRDGSPGSVFYVKTADDGLATGWTAVA